MEGKQGTNIFCRGEEGEGEAEAAVVLGEEEDGAVRRPRLR